MWKDQTQHDYTEPDDDGVEMYKVKFWEKTSWGFNFMVSPH